MTPRRFPVSGFRFRVSGGFDHRPPPGTHIDVLQHHSIDQFAITCRLSSSLLLRYIMDIFILRLLFLSFLVTCSLGFRSGSNFPTTKSDKKSFVDLRCIPKSTQPSSIAHLEDALLLQGRLIKSQPIRIFTDWRSYHSICAT